MPNRCSTCGNCVRRRHLTDGPLTAARALALLHAGKLPCLTRQPDKVYVAAQASAGHADSLPIPAPRSLRTRFAHRRLPEGRTPVPVFKAVPGTGA